MGTAQVQGELWGAKADDWTDLQEPAWEPVYRQVFERADVGSGVRLLDVGCGAGGALVAARTLGAEVAGLDAAHALAARARERLPGARIEVGEMEALPFEDASFDVVTGFNSFQFAGDMVQALREARRVCRPGGRVAMLVWGRRQDCDLCGATLPAVLALLPPAAGGQASLSEAGVIEKLMADAGLVEFENGEFDCAFRYPDLDTAWRAIASAGMLVRAVRLAGEQAVRKAVVESLRRFTRNDGSVVQHNRFRWILATPAGDKPGKQAG